MTTKVENRILVNVPVSTAYNQWTQFEDFPQFMNGITAVTHLSDDRLEWVAPIAGVQRGWEAKILEQIPDQKVAWAATDGATNAGEVTFADLGGGQTSVRLVARVRTGGTGRESRRQAQRHRKPGRRGPAAVQGVHRGRGLRHRCVARNGEPRCPGQHARGGTRRVLQWRQRQSGCLRHRGRRGGGGVGRGGRYRRRRDQEEHRPATGARPTRAGQHAGRDSGADHTGGHRGGRTGRPANEDPAAPEHF